MPITSKSEQNYINHIALVLDASGSMSHLQSQVVKVADGLIAHLAQRSKELDQETRVTVYIFGDTVKCVIYDKDVLRLPSLAKHYRISGMTALIDATLKSQDDLALIPEPYGDHAFLTYVLTDGLENMSKNKPSTLAARLHSLPDHWTVAVLVPDQSGKHEAKKFGFPADNVAIWDATTVRGLSEAGETIRTATENFMAGRAQGIRGSRSLFATDASVVNKGTIQAAGLKPLPTDKYVLVPVAPQPPEKYGQPILIKEFVEGCNHRYQVGKAFYKLSKPEKIQGNKQLAVVEKKTSKVYTGAGARDLVGLPDMEVRVKPDENPDYDIYVQSNSVNRHLVVGTKLLLLR